MENYYEKTLKGSNLLEVYNTGIERVRQYLDGEVEFVRRQLRGGERILEVGAGYGRIMKRISPSAGSILGIDISEDSVLFGREYLKDVPNCTLIVQDAYSLEYQNRFDMVLCLQNGLSSIKGNPAALVDRCMRALVSGGKAFFSTYSPSFWEYRLEWFQEQARKGLIGNLDMEKTGSGKIVCRDGFTATTFSAGDLDSLGRGTRCPFRIETVDESSLFLVVEKEPSEEKPRAV